MFCVASYSIVNLPSYMGSSVRDLPADGANSYSVSPFAFVLHCFSLVLLEPL